MLQRVVTVTACLITGWATGAAAADPATAPVWQRIDADGRAFQAVHLKLTDRATAVTPRVHAVLVDTSASQVGDHRVHALAVTQAFLGTLPKDHGRAFDDLGRMALRSHSSGKVLRHRLNPANHFCGDFAAGFENRATSSFHSS